MTKHATPTTGQDLEPENLVAITIEASAMARVPLTGTSCVPGRNNGGAL